MYESYEILKIKEKAGILSASKELLYRKQHKECLPLHGINNTKIYLVQTEEIQNRLKTITSLYQKIDSNQKVKEVIIVDSFHSATIEGARTTVESVMQSYDKPKTKDDKMVINTVHGMNYAYENKITINNIRELWNIVTKGVCENENLAGELFRTGMVYVGSNTDIIHTPAETNKIEGMMKELFAFINDSKYNIWITICIFHFYFVYTHPFCDGNGRMARILTNSLLLQGGMDKIKYLPVSKTINNNLSGYYTSLKDSEFIHTNGKKWIDITPFVDYLLEIMEKCMLICMKEDFKITEKQRLLLSKMQKEEKELK